MNDIIAQEKKIYKFYEDVEYLKNGQALQKNYYFVVDMTIRKIRVKETYTTMKDEYVVSVVLDFQLEKLFIERLQFSRNVREIERYNKFFGNSDIDRLCNFIAKSLKSFLPTKLKPLALGITRQRVIDSGLAAKMDGDIVAFYNANAEKI
jgi:hypothetical protein